jgi:hypothetical protein
LQHQEDVGIMAGLDDADLVIADGCPPVANTGVPPATQAQTRLMHGGTLVSTTAASGAPFSDYDPLWFALTHPQAFPWGTGVAPKGIALRTWCKHFLQRAPRIQHGHPMLLLDMFNILQRHEVNAQARVQMYVGADKLSALSGLTPLELQQAFELFASNARGRAYADAVQAAPDKVRMVVRTCRTSNARVEGTASSAASIRSRAIALWHFWGRSLVSTHSIPLSSVTV